MRDGNTIRMIYHKEVVSFSLPMRDGNPADRSQKGGPGWGFSLPMRDGNNGVAYEDDDQVVVLAYL